MDKSHEFRCGADISEEDLKRDYDILAKQCYLDGEDIIINVKREYRIALDQCKNHIEILRQVSHLCGKYWMTNKLIRRFINVALEANGEKLYP